MIIRCDFEARPLTREEVVKRIGLFWDGLRAIHPAVFSKLYFKAATKEEALKKEVNPTDIQPEQNIPGYPWTWRRWNGKETALAVVIGSETSSIDEMVLVSTKEAVDEDKIRKLIIKVFG